MIGKSFYKNGNKYIAVESDRFDFDFEIDYSVSVLGSESPTEVKLREDAPTPIPYGVEKYPIYTLEVGDKKTTMYYNIISGEFTEQEFTEPDIAGHMYDNLPEMTLLISREIALTKM